MHDDHFDRVAEQRLDRTLPIVTTRHAAASLRRKGFRGAEGLKTWQTRTFQKRDIRLRVTATPGRHGPALLARLLPPVMGSILDFETATGAHLLRIYISGDTLIFRRLKQIPKRFPGVDLALLHLGGTRVVGMLVTMDGKQGVEAMRIIAPSVAIPIHYNDYTVFKSPLEDFQREVKAAGLEQHVRYLAHGETYTFEIPDERVR
jgi:L-ascorbate metabolism protein UlaG (beta-lactamase superfamily)